MSGGVTPGLADIVAQLRRARERWRDGQHRVREVGGRELPSREALSAIVAGLRGALFPMRLGPPDLRQDHEDFYVGHTLDTALGALHGQIQLELRHQARSGTEEAAASSVPRCRRSASCSTATCSPRTAAIRRPTASTRCCCATRASTR